MKYGAAVLLGVILACSSGTSPATSGSASEPASPLAGSASPTPVAARVPPLGSQRLDAGCGTTDVYRSGSLPDWASVNAPNDLPYVIATPGLAVGYIFTYPLQAGLAANTKVLWYVATPRGGFPLKAEGHPLGASAPTAEFSKAADSSPGEIYPTGPTVPSAGCWHFVLAWHDGAEHAEVDLLFQ